MTKSLAKMRKFQSCKSSLLLNPSLNLPCHYDRNCEIIADNYNCIYLLLLWKSDESKAVLFFSGFPTQQLLKWSTNHNAVPQSTLPSCAGELPLIIRGPRVIPRFCCFTNKTFSFKWFFITLGSCLIKFHYRAPACD